MNTEKMSRKLIAPCGMNCRLCLAYKRKRNGCSGCRDSERLESECRKRCK